MQETTYIVQSRYHRGVSFEMRPIGPSMRMRVNAKMGATADKLRDLAARAQQLRSIQQKLIADSPEGKTGDPKTLEKMLITDEMRDILAQLVACDENYQIIQRLEVDPIWFPTVLVRITGEGFDDVTPEQLLENGPETLCDEIRSIIYERSSLSPKELENLSSPSTSSAAADGKANGIATNAASEPFTSPGNATAKSTRISRSTRKKDSASGSHS